MANSPQNRDAIVEVDLSKGIDADSLEKEGMSWAQNIEYRVNRIEVRGGFGTLSQFGTTLNCNRSGLTYGYSAPIGATLQVTNQGHAQILSLHSLSSYTGTFSGAYVPNLFALSVYDITTGRRAEHVFRSQTQWVDNMNDAALPSFDQPMWRQLPEAAVPVFVQLNDLQYIVIPRQGVWMYRPIDPYAIDQRLQTVPGTLQNGDSSWLESVQPSPGAYAATGAVYFTASTFPTPVTACAFQNRMVYANGRKLFFSDPDRPDNVQANSFYQVPTERPITAIASVKGVVLVFTMDETWMYQPNDPSSTGLISGGNIYNLSRSVGCLTAQSLTLMQDSIVFMDRRGVYVSNGGTEIQKISSSIDTWFALPEQIQNPLSSYLTQLGRNTLTNQQPRAFIDLQAQLYRSTMTWDPLNQMLYITFDDISLVYCPDFGWSVYLYETTAVMLGSTPKVGVKQRIIDPIMFAYQGDLYMIGGPDKEVYGDFVDSSVYILKAGRGGALDRSSVPQEDNRQPYENWDGYFQDREGSRPTFWVAPALLLPQGFKTEHQTTTMPTWLVPVYAANCLIHAATPVDSLALDVLYDSTNWEVLKLPSSASNYDYIVPPNRLRSKLGFTDMEEIATIFTDKAIRIRWNGDASPPLWSAYPYMALNINVPQPLVYLLMQRKIGTLATTSLSPNFRPYVTAQFNQETTPLQATVYIGNSASQPSYPEQDLGDNTHAQPVDWAISTPLLGDGKAQYKARGAFTTLQSYGRATDEQVPGWYIGPYASITTSDYKDFAAQQIDWDNNDPHEDPDKYSVRPRLEGATATFPGLKVGSTNPFDLNAPRWSSASDQRAGNMLIDDAATDTVAGSESVRGERFRTMLFGCMNANGEDVKIARVRILTRLTGGLRRTGRTRLT